MIAATQLNIGLKFKSKHFSDDAEVVAIREGDNEIDILLTTSEGHSRIVTWNLAVVKAYFEKGQYFIKPKEISVGI